MKRLSVSRLQISPSAEGCGKTEFSFYRVSRNVPLIQNHRGNSVHFTVTIWSPQNALLSLTYSPGEPVFTEKIGPTLKYGKQAADGLGFAV